eukprot:COSAG06_NODE_10105_length_1749_cov_2.206667_2_plen_384_part_01
MTALQLWLVLICGGSAASFQNHATAPANSASAAGDSDAGHTSITTWEFELDPHDLGVREQWFSPQAKPALARNITSPGPWEAMGVGKMGDYSGVGWYRQQLVVPAIPANGSLWLWIGGAPGGVLRSANVYANAVHIGRHVGYVDPLEMELTPAVQPGGTLTLAVAIDSRWNRTEDPLWASGALGSCFTGGCGGMLGNAQLQIRQRAWIEDSVTTSCADTGNGSTWRCAVGFSLVGDMNTDDRIGLTICESGQQSGAGQGCVTSTPAAVRSTAGDRMTLSLAIPAAKLWNPGTQQAQAKLVRSLVSHIWHLVRVKANVVVAQALHLSKLSHVVVFVHRWRACKAVLSVVTIPSQEQRLAIPNDARAVGTDGSYSKARHRRGDRLP